MDKILRIRMDPAGEPKVSVTPLGRYEGLGGRALTSAIVSNEVPPMCHPLGADNKLVIAPGLLSGSAAAVSGRLSVGCKSPLTGGIKEANAGGQAAQTMAKLGYAAVVLEGVPDNDNLYKVFISSEGVTITPDNSLKMLGKSVLENERNFNFKAGLSAADDRLPEYFKTEPLAHHDVTFGVKDEDLDMVFNW